MKPWLQRRFPLWEIGVCLFFSCASATAHAACELSRPDLVLDASPGTASFFATLDDPASQHRAAFSGGLGAAAGTLALGAEFARCTADSGVSLDAPARASYFVCMLDEAVFENGSPVSSQRRAMHVVTPLSAGLPVEISDANFAVHYLSFDSFKGLRVELRDTLSGETVRFEGPARSMGASFLLGLTLGDRNVKARFLRLGCVWTEDPSSFK